MGRGRDQFVGAAGQYYLAYGLSIRQLNTGLTLGNAPSVDVIASAGDGLGNGLKFQVKTSRNAHRRNRYGREGYEWDVGKAVIGKHSESFWYAFIDLRESLQGGCPCWNPCVFFVPSRWVAEFVKADFSRFVFFLPVTAAEITNERWDIVNGYLANDAESIKWANAWPKEKLVQWGKTS